MQFIFLNNIKNYFNQFITLEFSFFKYVPGSGLNQD